MELQESNSCACCAQNFKTSAIFCNSCGFPLQGTKEQQDEHIANRAVKEIDLMDLNRKVIAAGNSLYWIAGILTVSTIFSYFIVQNDEDIFAFLITSILLIGAFLAFGVWSKTKPAAALISGLSLYVIIQLINAVANPLTIFSGIIFKIIIIGYLIKGIIAVTEVDKIKKELNIK